MPPAIAPRIRVAAATASVIALTALLAGAASAAPAAAEPGDAGGQWVLRESIDGDGYDYLALNGATNTLFTDQFVPGSPAQLIAVDTLTGATGTAYDNGVAPQQSTSSINTTTNRMYVPSFGTAEILVVDATTGAPITSFGRDLWMPWGTAVDESTNLVYVTDGNDNLWVPIGNITVVDAATNTIVTTVDASNALGWPDVSETQRTLYVPVEGSDQTDSGVFLFDTVTNTITSMLQGTTPDQLVSPSMVIVDDSLGRAFVLNANTSAQPGGYASISTIDTATNAVVGEPVRLDPNFVPGDRFGYDPVTRLITLGGSYNNGTVNANPDSIPSVIWTIDAVTGTILLRTTLGESDSVFDTAIAAAAGTLYATVESEDTASRLLIFDWVDAAPAPMPAPAAAGLPDTGWNGTGIGWLAAALVIVGAGVGIATGVRRRTSHPSS